MKWQISISSNAAGMHLRNCRGYIHFKASLCDLTSDTVKLWFVITLLLRHSSCRLSNVKYSIKTWVKTESWKLSQLSHDFTKWNRDWFKFSCHKTGATTEECSFVTGGKKTQKSYTLCPTCKNYKLWALFDIPVKPRFVFFCGGKMFSGQPNLNPGLYCVWSGLTPFWGLSCRVRARHVTNCGIVILISPEQWFKVLMHQEKTKEKLFCCLT